MSNCEQTNIELRDRLEMMLKAGKVSFKFTKKDKTTRHAIGTLHPDYLPRQNLNEQELAAQQVKAAQSRIDNPFLIRYWDLGVNGFRAVDVLSLQEEPEVAE